MHSLGVTEELPGRTSGKPVHREAETKDGGRKRSGGEAGSMEDDRRHYRPMGATTHRLKEKWPEEEGSQEGGVQSTEEHVGRTVPKARRRR